ncbi:PrsW family intramembrane metalloprotease [Raineyella sp.]|uniref:PrsW family intramembrane metalloprotease n=1 Tax=Raineyella sp. TaxID=1911550 RepID=UPI002B215DD0|nr:PrsW family glutamic-type intramembrane protease [Raineyella sp.]MEA5154424.1 PrsW family glutamic-type intramembrane protease [Raineyella sp.]
MSVPQPPDPQHGPWPGSPQPSPWARPAVPPFPGYGMPTGPYRPVPIRTVRRAGAPLAGIILAAIGAAVIAYLALSGATTVGTFVGAVVLSTVGAVVVIACYMWLDRWEPEPPTYLIWAFLWGGGVATAGAMLFEELLAALVFDHNDILVASIAAPLAEEGLKGAFLLIMLTGLRRREMTSLTDTLVYAGMAGIGFAFVENLLYFSTSESVGQTTFMFFARILMGAFAHPFFTTITALGVHAATQQRSAGAKVTMVLLGFSGAMLLHGLWNFSSSFSITAYVLTYLVVMVPAFVVLTRQAIRSRRLEGMVVRRELPEMVWSGLISPEEAGWLGSLRTRAARTRGLPRDEARAVATFTDAVTELAFVRDRIKRGWSTPEQQAQQAELAMFVADLHAAAAPVIEPMTGGIPVVPPMAPPPNAPLPPFQPRPGGWRG